MSESHSLSGTRRMQSRMNLSAQPESCTWRSAIALAVHAQSPPADLALVEHPPLALALAEDTYRQAAKAACCFTCGAQESGLMRGARVRAQRAHRSWLGAWRVEDAWARCWCSSLLLHTPAFGGPASTSPVFELRRGVALGHHAHAESIEHALPCLRRSIIACSSNCARARTSNRLVRAGNWAGGARREHAEPAHPVRAS